MGWFFGKKSAANSESKSVSTELGLLAFLAIEQRRVNIIYSSLFVSDDSVLDLFTQTSSIGDKLKSKSDSSARQLMERGLRETSHEFSSDITTGLLRSSIKNWSLTTSDAYPRWLAIYNQPVCSRFNLSQFEDYTMLAFLLKRLCSVDEYIMLSNKSYFTREFAILKDFRLRILVESCMTKNGSRFSGPGFEDADFKLTPVPGSIDSRWHIHVKRFREFAILHTMMDDNNDVLSTIYRSDWTFSCETSLELGS